MTSEEHLLMTYEDHISFKAQVTNRNDLKVRYQAMGLIAAGILPLEVVAMYGGNIIGVLISSLWLGICMATLQWLQVRMVMNVYPELYISPLRWDRQGFITMQRRLLKDSFKERNIGKNGEAELKRMVERGLEKKYIRF